VDGEHVAFSLLIQLFGIEVLAGRMGLRLFSAYRRVVVEVN
jgi:hypothetical protein